MAPLCKESSTRGTEDTISAAFSEDLPLSWHRTETKSPQLKTLALGGGRVWIYQADIPFQLPLVELLEYCNKRFPNGWCARGCSRAVVACLGLPAEHSFSLGSHATLKLSRSLPAQVQALSRRAARFLRVTELQDCHNPQALLQELMSKSPYGKSPQLRFLFRTVPQENERMFCAIEQDCALPQAFVSLTRYASDAWHSEILLRTTSAPSGTMELLLSRIIAKLSSEGATRFSLGEVPFSQNTQSLSTNSTLHRLLQSAVPWSLYPSYDFSGLYSFKDKFQPQWEPTYWVASKGFLLRDMLRIGLKSKCFHLARRNLLWKSAQLSRDCAERLRIPRKLRVFSAYR